MNQNIAKKWVEALRSGEFIQGTGRLRRPVWETGNSLQYCCLGVLCELAVREGVIPAWDPLDPGYGATRDRSVLPIEVVKWAGIETHNPYMPSERASLTDLNDDKEHSFDMIADVIERDMLAVE